jgi:hypothetical protein
MSTNLILNVDDNEAVRGSLDSPLSQPGVLA